MIAYIALVCDLPTLIALLKSSFFLEPISEKYNIAETFPDVVSDLMVNLQIHLKDVEDRIPDQLAGRMSKE